MNYLPLYSRYIGGWNTESLARTIQRCSDKGMKTIIDYVREASKNEEEASNYSHQVMELGSNLTNQAFALKVSGFKNHSMMFPIMDVMTRNHHIVTLDAERVDTYEDISELANQAIRKYNKNHPIFFKTYQMYRKDALQELAKDIANTWQHGHYLGAKVVRGAYHHQDAVSGLLYTNIEDTHRSYQEGIRMIMWNMSRKARIRPIFATHNKDSVELVKTLSYTLFIHSDEFEFAQLLGMGDAISRDLAHENYLVRKYVPFGSICESVPYLVRRLHENPEIAWHF